MINYNFSEKILHDFVFSNKFINQIIFKFEKYFLCKKVEIHNKQHVFITGLPRSGTTCILNFIYSLNKHASLTYKNMPFILSPNFSKLLNKNNVAKKERIHGDNIFFDINSPEEFDEVFFSYDEQFIKKELKNYIYLILLSEKKNLYLSKNNLNYKRIDFIQEILPNSIFIIPIREPLQQAYSLLNQHVRFSELQKKEDFIRRYMNYVGHKEFGLNHESWNCPIKYKNFNNLNYWLEQWTLFYSKIYSKYRFYKNCYFLKYEKLGDTKDITIILNKLNINSNEKINFNYFYNSNKKKIDIDYSQGQYDLALSVYNKF